MKKVLTIVLVAAGLFLSNNKAEAQNKIGFISLNELIAGMPEAKKADSALQQFRDALVASAQDKEAALNEAITKFNQDSAKLAVAVKDVKRRDLQARLQELQGEDQRIQQDLQKKQEEMSGPIQKKAIDAVNAVAKENGYGYVFHKEALLVSPPGEDITPLVKKKLGIR